MYCWHTLTRLYQTLEQPSALYYLKPRSQGTGRSHYCRAVVSHFCSDDPEASCHHGFPAAPSYALPHVPQASSGANPAESCFCCPLYDLTHERIRWRREPVQKTHQQCCDESRTTASDHSLPLSRGSRHTRLRCLWQTKPGEDNMKPHAQRDISF